MGAAAEGQRMIDLHCSNTSNSRKITVSPEKMRQHYRVAPVTENGKKGLFAQTTKTVGEE
ncbi:hypothetical protein [Rhizobium freirei]|uniref:hypothetical protein n=1 Tax=Rhizobium freirei TaxID=1353277 RepID=UPI00056A82C9|nr:hypothetical protein [Rhizobium freirei]